MNDFNIFLETIKNPFFILNGAGFPATLKTQKIKYLQKEELIEWSLQNLVIRNAHVRTNYLCIYKLSEEMNIYSCMGKIGFSFKSPILNALSITTKRNKNFQALTSNILQEERSIRQAPI